jgi:Tfp pilus assembly protein PilO
MVDHDPARKLKLLGNGLHAAGLATVLLIAGAGYVFLLGPIGARIDDCLARADLLDTRLQSADKLRAEHQELTHRSAALTQEASALAKRVPDETLEAEFLSHVAAAAGQLGLKILDYRPASASVQENCSQMEIQLSCSGPYRSLCGFLDRLGALDRLSRVTQAEVSTAGPEGCAINMTLVVFFRLAAAAATPATEPKPGGIKRG